MSYFPKVLLLLIGEYADPETYKTLINYDPIFTKKNYDELCKNYPAVIVDSMNLELNRTLQNLKIGILEILQVKLSKNQLHKILKQIVVDWITFSIENLNLAYKKIGLVIFDNFEIKANNLGIYPDFEIIFSHNKGVNSCKLYDNDMDRETYDLMTNLFSQKCKAKMEDLKITDLLDADIISHCYAMNNGVNGIKNKSDVAEFLLHYEDALKDESLDKTLSVFKRLVIDEDVYKVDPKTHCEIIIYNILKGAQLLFKFMESHKIFLYMVL